MGKITINELHKSLFDYVQAVSDDKLETRDKTIVGAINELFSNNNNDTELNNLINEISNGKQLIANAIGEPLNVEDTFSAMSSDINSLLSQFKTNMMNNGVTVESGDKFKSLIDKIATMVEEGEGKGIQFAEGIETIIVDYTGSGDFRQPNAWEPVKQISINVGFKPIYVLLVSEEFQFCQYEGTDYSIPQGYFELNNMSYCDINYTEYGGKMVRDAYWYKDGTSDGSEFIFDRRTEINNTGFDLFYRFLHVWSGYAIQNLHANVPLKWIAIGVGEEDTALRDSLASILEDEGVDVTEEDDMADLIVKVDEEFDNRKQILVNALVNEGLNAKITNTYEELITMISLLKYVPANSIINGNSTDSDFINGLTSYSRNRGDADSEITYSVSNNTIIVEGSADCVETTNGQADEGRRDLYIYNPSYTVDVTDYDVFKVIASYSFYDMEYGCLEVGLYTGSDFRNPVKTIENGDLDITDLTGEYHIVINAFVWNEYCLGETGILEGKVSYIGFE